MYLTAPTMRNQLWYCSAMLDVERLRSEKYSGEKSDAFFADVARLEAGEPLAYLIGNIPFLNTIIYLDSRPLIPRTETEFWVEQAIVAIKSAALTAPRILDLCAGSGCIGVGIAKEIPTVHVTFAELEPAHLLTITKNIKKNIIIDDSKKYQVVQSDLFTNVAGTYDFILSNPPYVDPALDRVEPSVRAHEPAAALYGGKAGFEIIERILSGARAKLAPPSGQLWLEHEPEQVAQLQRSAESHGLIVTTHTDQYNVPRYSIITVAQ